MKTSSLHPTSNTDLYNFCIYNNHRCMMIVYIYYIYDINIYIPASLSRIDAPHLDTHSSS